MAKILLMDDEPISLQRLCEALSTDPNYTIWTADNTLIGDRIINKIGNKLDLIVIDASMDDAAARSLLDAFKGARGRGRVLILSPTTKPSFGRLYPVLRKPFSDGDFIGTVARVLAIERVEGVSAKRTAASVVVLAPDLPRPRQLHCVRATDRTPEATPR